MKKTVLFIIVAVTVFICTACFFSEENVLYKNIKKDTGISVHKGSIEEYIDTHGGFHGDGETFAKIVFTNNDAANKIQNSENWKALPLSEDMEMLLHGIEGNGPYISVEEGGKEFNVPQIENGYYYFYNRHSKTEDPYDESKVFGHGSFNFTACVYDTDENVLYYVKLDT